MSTRIETFFASLADLNKAITLITPEAQFVAVRAETYSDLPIYGTYVGYQGLRDFVTGLRQCFDTQLFVIDHIVENDTLGAAFGRFDHRVRATDKPFKSRWAVMCQFEDGKISSYQFYEDTAALEEAMNCRTQNIESVV